MIRDGKNVVQETLMQKAEKREPARNAPGILLKGGKTNDKKRTIHTSEISV